MTYCFISDDRYLLTGLEQVLPDTVIAKDAVFVFSGNDDSSFKPTTEDMVLISLMNITLRNTFMRNKYLALVKVIMLVKQGLHHTLEGMQSP